MPAKPSLSLYHSLVVPLGGQSNLPYSYVSLAYRQILDGQECVLWIGQCDGPLWEGPSLKWRALDDLRVNEVVDGYSICRLKLLRDSTYLHVESTFAARTAHSVDARSLQEIVPR